MPYWREGYSRGVQVMIIIIIIIITTLFQSQSDRYEGQQVHIIYTEPVLARRPEQPVTNNKV